MNRAGKLQGTDCGVLTKSRLPWAPSIVAKTLAQLAGGQKLTDGQLIAEVAGFYRRHARLIEAIDVCQHV